MKLFTELSEDIEYITEAKETGEKQHYIHGKFLVGNKENKNKRIYPSDVLSKEVERYIKELVNEKRAYGELGHPCLSDSAEVLTETRGWKHIKDLNVGENVYTLEPSTQTIELCPVEDIHINHFTGKMIKMKNRTFETLVTPYHKFLTYYRDGKPYWITADEIKLGIDNNISKLAKFAIPKVGDYKDKSPITIEIANHTWNFKDFCSFLSLYLAEGCTIIRKHRKNSYKIQIFQNYGEKSNIIDDLFSKLPVKFSRYEKNGKVTWSCYNRDLGTYLYKFGKSHEKYIDPEILNLMDQETSFEFLKFYVLGDGRGQLDKKRSMSCEVFSTSKRMIEDISIVSVKSGYCFHEYVISEFQDVVIENRIIKAENKKPLHFLKLLKSESIWLDKRHLQIEEIDWDDDVYCITTKNSTFLVKDNGYCYWSGNCGPQINLDRVSHIITELKRDGDDFIGKAVITDTPMGNIAKGLLKSGAKLGVSSRGTGSLKPNKNGIMEVQGDFRLATAGDIVADPSAPGAYVNGVMENVEWVYDPIKNTWYEEKLHNIKKMSKTSLEENKLRLFEDYISFLTSKN